MPREKERHLPSCPFTVHCVRLIDELDTWDNEHYGRSVVMPTADIKSLEDESEPAAVDGLFSGAGKDARLVERLLIHLPTCPTCQAAVEQARRQRAQLRAALRDMLSEGEQHVPSTTAAILSAIHHEQSPQQSEAPVAGTMANPSQSLDAHSPVRTLNGQGRKNSSKRSSRRRVLWQNIVAVAAVLILLLSAFALLDHRLFTPSSGNQGNNGTPAAPGTSARTVVNSSTTTSSPGSVSSPTSPTSPAPFGGWNRVAVFTSGMTLGNLNYLADCCAMLASSKLSPGTVFDGVSPDGQNVMYHTDNGGITAYYTLVSAQKNSAVYSFQGSSGNAVWMDKSHVLITTYNSIVEVDVQAGRSATVLPSLVTPRLTFYRKPFLYFTGGSDRSMDALYRINMDTSVVQQVTFRSTGTTFWLSPDGYTVYFANPHGPAGLPGIYAVNSDGSNMHSLRQYLDGTPIGYGYNNALLIMRVVNGAFQVVQLGTTAQQDVVLLRDAAPGASALCNTTTVGADPICDVNIALAPYGHALVVQGLYAGGTYKVWSDDLTTGQQRVIPSLSGTRSAVRFIGWDTLVTP